MAEAAGVPRRDTTLLQQRAKAAEDFVARAYGGELRWPRDPRGDVDLPGRIIDVKSVEDGFGFVNAGRRRPTVTVIVVAFRRLPENRTPDQEGWSAKIVGRIEPEQWLHGRPPVPGRRSQPCWFVLRSAVLPAPLRAPQTDAAPREVPAASGEPVRRLELGRDEPPRPWRRDVQSDAKRAYDREAKRRQRLRSDNAPIPAFYDDTPPPGRLRSGLVERKPPRREGTP
jgi:hypothetical protein